MANYNYVTSDIVDIIDDVIDGKREDAIIKSSRGKVCSIIPLYSDGVVQYISVSGDGCCFVGEVDNLGKIVYSILLALQAHLKLDYYGYLKCEFSGKPNTIWYFDRYKQLVFLDANGDYHILCEC